MSLQIDYRRGSVELDRRLHPYGIQPEVVTLEFGDFAWDGQGPGGELVRVGVERKRIDGRSTDLLDSLRNKRLQGYQVHGLVENYDYRYLLVEGVYRPGENGEIEILGPRGWRSQSYQYSYVSNYLNSIMLRSGVIPIRSSSEIETAAILAGLYKSWQVPWEEHKSHEAVYAPSDPTARVFGRRALVPRDITLVETMAMQIPGLGAKARDVADHFGSVQAMVDADEEEWGRLRWTDRKGGKKKLGKDTIRKITGMLQSYRFIPRKSKSYTPLGED